MFPQHIVEGLLNSRRRVSDRPSWILIFKTPARKPTNVIIVVFFLFPEQEGRPEPALLSPEPALVTAEPALVTAELALVAAEPAKY